MIQFYFLSILFNALSGYILSIDQSKDEYSLGQGIEFSVRNDAFRLVLGVLTMITGLLKLLSSTRGDIPIIGDSIPAAAGLVAGFILIFEYYNSRSALNTEKAENLALFLEHNKKWIGFISIASAVLHFLFPSVLFL